MTLDRRQFLQITGAGAVALVVAACTSNDDKPKVGSTTTTVPPASSSVALSDVALLKTAASLEALAVSVYKRVTATTIVKDPTAREGVALFQSHHVEHLAGFNALLTSADTPAVTNPNAAMGAVFDPAVAAVTTEADVERVLLTLEDALSQTYVYFSGVATRPDYRSTLMTVAGAQARQRALLGFTFIDQPVTELFPAAFAKDDNPLPPDAIIT